DDVCGTPVPAGSTVAVLPYLIHRNPAVWPNPARFDPARFLSPAPGRHRYAWIPFGGGKRGCIGAGFVDPQLSLHYWDWTQDPTNAPDGSGGFVDLFTPDFMGSAHGQAGEPWLSAGFYDPTANPFRSDSEFDPANNPVDPPRNLER